MNVDADFAQESHTCVGSTLLTDLYQLSMAQGYREHGKEGEEACFHMYFRENPFGGSFAVACGMAQLTEIVDSFHFSPDDLEYLASIEAPLGGKLFSSGFLGYLRELELKVDIDAVREGSVVFANEPLVRVCGPILQCQLLETALLNCINFQTLIATKAARICRVAQVPVAEFGLRRAQGAGGGLWASRAAMVGGCSSTSNVLAGKIYGVPVSGTHSHSWVMSFDNEKDAFRAFAESTPKNCTLLVDTYDSLRGIENAISVGKEMARCGERLAGIRLDSGDLARLSRLARARLDAEGLQDCKIVASGDLDEYAILALEEDNAKIDAYGVGTRLATGYDQPALGGVYKLSAIKRIGSVEWEDRLKLSESAAKLTTPGIPGVRRYFREDGSFAGDMVYDVEKGVLPEESAVGFLNSPACFDYAGMRYQDLLEPFVREGRLVARADSYDAMTARSFVKSQMEAFDPDCLSIEEPSAYPVGLEVGLYERRCELIAKARNMQ